MKYIAMLLLLYGIHAYADDQRDCRQDIFTNNQQETKQVALEDIGLCIGECASEQGMCIARCEGDGRCIAYCNEVHARCVAKCTR